MAPAVMPRIVPVLHNSRKFCRWALASSFGLPQNGLAYTMFMRLDFSSKFTSPTLTLGPIVLTPFFGTRQKDDEGKEYQIKNGDGARRKGIGHGVVPIRRLGVYGQVLIRDGLSLESGVFCLLKLVS